MTSATATQSAAPLRDQLRKVFARVKLPTSPALATRILTLADNPDTTMEQFAETIQVDAGLAARLLRIANSAQYGLSQPITTIQRAVNLLGVSQVRAIALGFQLVSHLNRLGNCPFDMKRYWQHSVLRACLAREAAVRLVPGLAEEAFLVGLLQDCGVLLLVQLLGEEYARLYRPDQLSPLAFYQAELELAAYTHVDAAVAMVEEWKLPEAIRVPISRHHKPTPLTAGSPDLDRLCAVSYLVGSMRFVDNGSAEVNDATLRDYAASQMALTEAGLEDLFSRAAASYARLAGFLRESLPDRLDVTELLSEANRQLTAAVGDADQQARTARAERDEVRRQQAQLSSALGEYRERAARDPLTGVLNRGALAEAAARHIDQARAAGSSVTVLFLDVDNFKRLNDTHGHRAGDFVLRAVANALCESLTHAGTVGRYGGEEFVVVIPGLTSEEAADHGARVLQSIRALDVRACQLPSPVTCSAGVLWAPAQLLDNPEPLFAAADEAMYEAKRAGKDRISFRALDLARGGTSTGIRAVGDDARAAAAAVRRVIGEACPGAATSIGERLRAIGERLNSAKSTKFVNLRKQQRQDLLTPCVLNILVPSTMSIEAGEACVRNISTGGIGLLAPRHLCRGDAVEVCIQTHGSAKLYTAGLVAFCRHVEDNVYEIGVQFTAHSRQPIFSANPEEAAASRAWLAKAIQEIRSQAFRGASRFATPAPP
jgi:diguanylate cyclase (GGDEF)-like protein